MNALLALVLLAAPVREEKPTTVSAEAGGPLILIGGRIDHSFTSLFGIGASVGYFPCFEDRVCSSGSTAIVAPHAFLDLGDVHALRLEAGGMWLLGTHDSAVYASLGYRLQLHAGFTLFAGGTIFRDSGSHDFFPWPDLQLGWAF